MNKKSFILSLIAIVSTMSLSAEGCTELPTHAELSTALKASVKLSAGAALPGINSNGGFGTNMWAAIVNRDGVVCAITRTDDVRTNQWPGSRVIAAQKANTANAFSLPNLALSSSNLYAASQPNKWASGLQFSNPVNPSVAYEGDATFYGTSNDPMMGQVLGGINIFAGGIALYNVEGTLIGALGVSGDTSCADHNVAWRTRDGLGMDNVPAGIPEAQSAQGAPALPSNITAVGDNVLYDFASSEGVFLNPGQAGFAEQQSLTGFGHPVCLGNSDRDVNAAVVSAHPIGPNP